jgi:hypothetical protein
MTSTPRAAALLAGLAYVALGVVTLTGPTVPDHDWGTRGAVVDALGLVGFALTVLGAERLRTPLALGRVGLVGLRGAQAGLVAMSVESVASLVHGGNTLSALFLVGLLLTLVGFLVVGVDGMRHPGARWVAPLPFLGLLLGIGAGDHGGFVLLGVVWIVLALAAVGRPATTAVPVAA